MYSVLQAAVEPVPSRGPPATTESYVDDVAQTSGGPVDNLVGALLTAGTAFARGIRGLKLKISARKSVIVLSDMVAARRLQRLLRGRGIQVNVATNVRDVGVGYAAGRRRTMKVQRNRRKEAAAKTKRTGTLVKACKAARKLLATGSWPKASWGHQASGIAPAAMRQIRGSFANALLPGARGRCATSTIALLGGQGAEPAIRAARDQYRAWLSIIDDKGIADDIITRAWHKSLGGLSGLEQHRVWHHIRGPTAATVITLKFMADDGWCMASPFAWSSGGDNFDLRAPSHRRLVEKHIAFTLQRNLWEEASNFYCGAGLEHGVDVKLTMLYHSTLGAAKHAKKRGVLERILVGGQWPAARCRDAGYSCSSLCPRCGLAEEDLEHQCWGCGRNAALSTDVINTESMASLASRSPHKCFWLRGVVPKIVVAPSRPPPKTDLSTQVSFEGRWTGGRYYTDGSGGRDGAIPHLRRCAWSVVRSDDNGCLTCFAFGALPGKAQSVPRAELYAILYVVERASGPVQIFTDSKIAVDGFKGGPNANPASAMAGLWSRFWASLKDGSELVWVPSHKSEADVTSGVLPLHALVGNAMADEVATVAAAQCALPQADADRYELWKARTIAVQKRLVEIALDTFSFTRRDGEEQEALPRPPPKLPVAAAALRSEHRIAIQRGVHRCLVCLAAAKPTEPTFRDWLESSCPGAEPVPFGEAKPPTWLNADPSHTIRAHRGMAWCTSCGCWGSTAPKGLRIACQPATDAGCSVLVRLRRHQTPVATACWPDLRPETF